MAFKKNDYRSITLILVFIWWRLQRLIKIMASVGDILDDDEFFRDAFDTPKEATEQHKKREELKSIKDKDKLGHKWTHKRVDKQAMKLLTKRTPNTSSMN